LFVRYDPSNIVAGAREDFEKRMQTKEDTLAKRREQAQTAKGNGESSASDSAASDADAQIAAAAEEANAAPKEGRTPRERKQGPGQTSGTAEAAKSKAPGAP
jgi:hypothetical protein